MTKDEINKILVEAEGGCQHIEGKSYNMPFGYIECIKCKGKLHPSEFDVANPDFFQWENFGRLLGIMRKKDITMALYIFDEDDIREAARAGSLCCGEVYINSNPIRFTEIDQIPSLVATELARMIKEKVE